MSGKLMGSVYEYQFSHGQQAVLLAMADHAEDDGSHVFPSVSYIAWKTDYHRRNVQRLMKELRDMQVLVEVRPARHDHPAEYFIDLSAAQPKPPYVPTKKTRAKVPGELRWAVWERDNFTCQECKSRRDLSIDHIKPLAQGGETTFGNLQTLCKTCNALKGTSPAIQLGGGMSSSLASGVAEGAVPAPPKPSVEPPVEPSTTSGAGDSGTDEGSGDGGGQPGSVATELAAAEAGGVGQTTMSIGGDEDIDTLVEALWAYYVEMFEPARPSLTPSRARAIRKGFKEEFGLDDLKLAVLGLKIWRQRKSGDESISTLFTTYPGGQTLADRIAFFIEVAEKAGPAGSITSADPAIVQQKQLDVQRGHRSTSPESVQAAEEAEEWLRQHGIETVRGDDGYPTFRVGGGAS